MKLTNQELMQIIREELNYVLKEAKEEAESKDTDNSDNGRKKTK